MKKHRLFFITILALGFQLPLFAAEDECQSPIPEMDNLITSGQYQAALTLGNDNLADCEGIAEFDYLYGLAALETGSPNEAVFALERVAATASDSMLREIARLELARAYFVTNNLSAAENIFTQVLENNPPANVQQNIEAFLAIIDARRSSQRSSINWTLSSSFGSDSNINSATSNGTVDTPLIGQIELNPDGQETDDNFSNTTLSLNYNYPFTRDRSLDININAVNLNNLDTDQFDIGSLRSEIGYNWGNENNRIRHGISLTQVALDQNGFQESKALSSSWQHAGNNGWYQTLSASYAEIRYDTGNGGEVNSLRDVDQLLFTAGLTKISGLFTHSLNLYQADEDPDAPMDGDHNGRSFTGLAYSVLFRLNSRHTPYLRASIQDVEHDSEHPVYFDTIREDDTESISLGWFWQIGRGMMITAEATYTENGSNIELFDYSRFKYQAGFRYQF